MPQVLTVSIATSAENEEWTVASNGDDDFDIPLGKTVILATASSGPVAINLPSASGVMQDRMITVKKIDAAANDVVVTPDGGDTIDGAGSYTLDTQYESVMIVSDGADWFIV